MHPTRIKKSLTTIVVLFAGNVAMAANPNRMSEMKQASDYQKIQIFTGTGIKVRCHAKQNLLGTLQGNKRICE